jgi:hypothetical protein
LKWGIVKKIEEMGYSTEIFFDSRGLPTLAGGVAWSASKADEVARRCMGAAILGFSRWTFADGGQEVTLPTEFNHYECALAHTLGLPLLMMVQQGVMRRCVFDNSYGPFMAEFPPVANSSWLTTPDAVAAFSFWKIALEKRRDVFLGYCGSSAGVARNIKRFLTADLKLTVLDWMTDFPPAGSILDRIKNASERCSGGIFLFTKDDELNDSGPVNKAVPRDNVVFEAGYFIHAKGKERVLIVLEQGAKMPADLGGDIYASLVDRSNIEPIEQTLNSFVANF